MTDFKTYIHSARLRVCKGYFAEPQNLVRDFNIENEKEEGYRGRQLFEMLQNADDAAGEMELSTSKKGRFARIELIENQLIISNNGAPFSEGGLNSLLYSNKSPKFELKNQIGNKGTGFRSILSWATDIYIRSHGLSVRFSQACAEAFLDELLSDAHQENKGSVAELKNELVKYKSLPRRPIAILRAPEWEEISPSDVQEFDTSIVITVRQNAAEEIERQMKSISLEILLFLQHLDEVVLDWGKDMKQYRRKIIGDHQSGAWKAELSVEDDPNPKLWELRADRGEINDKKYEMIVAWTEGMTKDDRYLHTFFPTKVRMPFRMLLHGTFKLDSSRDHLVAPDIENEKLLEKLATLIFNSIEEIASNRFGWDAMQAFADLANVTWDTELTTLGFPTFLENRIKESKIIPLADGTYASVQDAPLCFVEEFADYLDTLENEKLSLKVPAEIISFLSRLGLIDHRRLPRLISGLDSMALNKRLPEESRLPLILLCIREKGRLFSGIATESMPSLLVDRDGEPIPASILAFTGALEDTLKLPTEINFRILSQELFSKIKKASGKTEAEEIEKGRDLQKVFNVREYKTEDLVRKVANFYSEAIEREPTFMLKWLREMLEALKSVHLRYPEPNVAIREIDVPLLNRLNEVRPSRTLYLNAQFRGGEIVDKLFSGWNDAVIVADASVVGLESSDSPFLDWLGVMRSPSFEIHEKHVSDFKGYFQYCKECITREDLVANGFQDLSEFEAAISWSPWESRLKLRIPAILEGIVANSPTEAILLWLHSIQDQLVSYEASSLPFTFRRYKMKYHSGFGSSKWPSYFRWYIRTQKWMTFDEDQSRENPGHFVIGEALKELSETNRVISKAMLEQLSKHLQISVKDLRELLKKVGVLETLADTSPKQLVEILRKVGSADKEFEQAKRIYSLIKEQIDVETYFEGGEYQAYRSALEDISFWATKDGVPGRFLTKEIFYVENLNFCSAILQDYPVLLMARRSGPQKIEQLFGVRSFAKVEYDIQLADDGHSGELSSAFEAFLEEAKPYLFALRVNKAGSTEIAKFRRLKIDLCRIIKAKYKVPDGEWLAVTLQPREFIFKNDTYYLMMDPGWRHMQDFDKDFSFQDAVAEILAGVIDVSEVRRDFREILLQETAKGRKQILSSEKDEPIEELLQKSRMALGQLPQAEIAFWNAVAQSLGSLTTFDQMGLKSLERKVGVEFGIETSLQRSLDFENMNGIGNFEPLTEIIKRLNLNVERLNQAWHGKLNFNERKNNELAILIHQMYHEFAGYLHSLAVGSKMKAQFLTEVKRLHNISLNLLVTAYDFDVKEFLHDEILRLYGIDWPPNSTTPSFNCFERLAAQKVAFKAAIRLRSLSLEHVEEFFKLNDHESLLLFEDTSQALPREYEQLHPEIITSDETRTRSGKFVDFGGMGPIEYQDGDYTAILDAVRDTIDPKNQEVKNAVLGPPPIVGTSGKGGSGGGRGSSDRTDSGSDKKLTGLIGEFIVFHELSKSEELAVEWLSENGVFGHQIEKGKGNDDLGYDMVVRYTHEPGRVPDLVEVKSSIGEPQEFIISEGELSKARENSERYRVILVTYVLDPQKREVIDLGYFFDLSSKTQQGWMSNDRFTVRNKNYRIQFSRVAQ